MLRTLWYYPTPADARQRLVEAVFGKPPIGDMEEAALRMRVEGFYAIVEDTGFNSRRSRSCAGRRSSCTGARSSC